MYVFRAKGISTIALSMDELCPSSKCLGFFSFIITISLRHRLPFPSSWLWFIYIRMTKGKPKIEMPYISPYKDLASLSLLDKFGAAKLHAAVPKLGTFPKSSGAAPKPFEKLPSPPSLTKEAVDFDGCHRCSEKAVCATHSVS